MKQRIAPACFVVLSALLLLISSCTKESSGEQGIT